MDKHEKQPSHSSRKMALSTKAAVLFVSLCLLAVIAMIALLIGYARAQKPLLSFHMLFPFVLLAGLFLIVVLAYRGLFLPYANVKNVLHRYNTGKTTEELFHLQQALTPEFPTMLIKISEALDRRNQLQTAMKQAEFLALQNQINPHFLYNTLEAIRGDALRGGLMNIVDVAEALAIYFRYTISRVNKLVTLADELRNAQSYFAVQKYRYGERVNMETRYAPEDEHLLQVLMPKLTLQPIIENAVTHGLEPKVSAGHIVIRFECTKSRLIVEISDDGVGVSPKALQALNERLKNTTPESISEQPDRDGGIALSNVNNRLRLLFGERYGLSLDSTQGLGTDVTITLPLTFDASGEGLL